MSSSETLGQLIQGLRAALTIVLIWRTHLSRRARLSHSWWAATRVFNYAIPGLRAPQRLGANWFGPALIQGGGGAAGKAVLEGVHAAEVVHRAAHAVVEPHLWAPAQNPLGQTDVEAGSLEVAQPRRVELRVVGRTDRNRHR
jgi:hypothetical protein